MDSPNVIIVGGGISGLSTAYYLAKAGIPFTLVEKNSHLGGVIVTQNASGCVVELGPDSYLSSKPGARDLINEVGLGGEVIGSKDDERETFIWKSGKLNPIPDGLQFMVPTKIGPILQSPLFSFKAKIQMGKDLFRKPPAAPLPDRSVAEFVSDHLGQEVVDYLAEPLLSGVYGGDPAELSVQCTLPRFVELETKYGSLTKGSQAEQVNQPPNPPVKAIPLFSTLRGGLSTLIDRLLEAAADYVSGVRGEATRLERTPGGWLLRVEDQEIEAKHVVLACEAHSAARLLGWADRPLDDQLVEALASIPYSSSMTVSMAFDGKDLKEIPKGFGFLVPKVERSRVVACTFTGNKFPYRESGDLIAIRCFLGGAADPEVLNEPDGAVETIVLNELREKLDITAKPVFCRIGRWPRSMAQYTVGHAQRAALIEERLKEYRGLYVAGNGYTGIGIPDCVRMAKAAVAKIAASPA